jgi:uncharacterized damage-inducible protein DinB
MKDLRSTLEQHPDVFDQPFETLSSFKCIRLLVAHMAGAEERWVLQRLCNTPPGPRLEERAPESLDGVFDEWERIRANTRAFVAALDIAGLSGMIPVSLPHHGYEGRKTVEQILFQVFNHQTYHLGQISMTLQRLGIDPPNFDYILLPDEPH